MTENTLTVVTGLSGPLVPVDVRNLSYDALDAYNEAEATSSRMFPGEALTFDGKRGKFSWGFGKKRVDFDHKSSSLILNVPNCVELWQTFVEGRPVFVAAAMPFTGQRLPDRKTLGQNDPNAWPVNKFNKPDDPFKRVMVIPFRLDGDKTGKVHHMNISQGTSIREFKEWLRTEYSPKARTQGNKLPVVNLGTDTYENADGSNDVIAFELVDWETPTEADVPSFGAAEPAKTEPELLPPPQVQSVNRNANMPNTATAQTVEAMARKAGATVLDESIPTFEEATAKPADKPADMSWDTGPSKRTPRSPQAPATTNGAAAPAGRRRAAVPA